MPVIANYPRQHLLHRSMDFLERLTLGSKLRYGLGVLLGIMLLLSAHAIHGERQQAAQLRDMYMMKLVGLSVTKEIHTHLMEVGRNLRQMLLARNATERDAAWRALDHSHQELRRNMEEGKTRFNSEKGQRLLAETLDTLERYLQRVNEITDQVAADPAFTRQRQPPCCSNLATWPCLRKVTGAWMCWCSTRKTTRFMPGRRLKLLPQPPNA
jgi:hypothetical protein